MYTSKAIEIHSKAAECYLLLCVWLLLTLATCAATVDPQLSESLSSEPFTNTNPTVEPQSYEPFGKWGCS